MAWISTAACEYYGQTDDGQERMLILFSGTDLVPVLLDDDVLPPRLASLTRSAVTIPLSGSRPDSRVLSDKFIAINGLVDELRQNCLYVDTMVVPIN